MKHSPMNLAAAIGLALPLVIASFGPVAAQDAGGCLSPREVQQGIQSGEIVTVDEAMSAGGVDDPPIGQARVCRRDGNLEWHVNTMDGTGEAAPRVLNAQGG